jgi:hypothetical protein
MKHGNTGSQTKKVKKAHGRKCRINPAESAVSHPNLQQIVQEVPRQKVQCMNHVAMLVARYRLFRPAYWTQHDMAALYSSNQTTRGAVVNYLFMEVTKWQ